MSTIDDIVLQMKILTNKITVFRSTITSDMTTESQARINYDEYLRDLVQGLQDQISSIDITNNTAGILDVINAVSTAIDSHQLVLSPQATIRAIKRIAPLNGGTVNVTEDANNIFIHGEGNGISRQRIVRYTSSATLKLADANCIIECDSVDPIVLTVPNYDAIPFKSAVLFDIVQINTGSVTIVGDTGVTIESNGLVLDSPDSMGQLYRRDTVNKFVFSIAPPADWNTLSNRPDNLVSLGGLTGAANFFPAFSGLGTLILKAISSFGYSFVAAVDATAAKLLLALTKSDVGLSNVDNTSDLNKPVSTAQDLADTTTLNSAKTYADNGDAVNLAAAKTYADNLVVGLFDFRGSYDASTGLFPTVGGSGSGGAVLKGDIWRISVAGTIGGVTLRVGDSIYATIDTPAQVVGNWGTILLELGYNPEDVARKATDLLSPDNIKYPTTLAVSNAIETQRIKHWEEVSTAINATTQRLTWRPKDPNGTFVRANSLLGIDVPRALTLEDTAAVNYATGFTEGLNLQVKPGGYSVNSTQGFAFGTNNQVTNFNTAIGAGNRVTSANGSGTNYTSTNTAVGYNNNVANQGYSYCMGMANTMTGGAYRNNTFGQNNTNSGIYSQAFGDGNNTSSGGCAFGVSNTASASGWAFGQSNIVGGTGSQIGLAVGINNNVKSISGGSPTAIALGRNNTVSDGALAIGTSNNGIAGSRHFGDSNSGGGIRIGNSNTGTTGGAAIGNSNTVASNAYILGNSNLTTATATASLILGDNKRDNGLRNFSSVGDQARVVFKNLGLDTNVLWTDTSWRDVVNGKLLSPTNAIEQAKFTVSMDIRFTNGTSPAGAVALAVERKAIIFIEVWTRDDGTLVPIRKVIDAGDSDIFTYIDIQAIADGTGIKLQWKYASNPASSQTQSSSGTDDGVNVNLYMAGIIESLITRV